MKFLPLLISFCALVFCVAVFGSAGLAMGDDWRAIDPADLALKAPIVEKDADAEAIFWEVRVADEVDGDSPRTVMNHYIRIKIFTDRGRESQSKIDIQYLNSWSIKDIAARTIKPDGSILEIKKEDVFERTIEKSNGRKIKAKSFAMPGVEPGGIIEYRWREVHNDDLAQYAQLQMQRDIPVRLVKYYIKPLESPYFPYGMRARSFQFTFKDFTKEKNGFYSISSTNVPAFHEEPRMPPEDSVRPWMLIYYTEDKKQTADQFWRDYGKQKYEQTKARTKVSDEIRAAATKAIGDATTPEDKLNRLFDFCRSSIKNVNNDSSITAEERARIVKENKTPADTLKHGRGTGFEIDMLFTSLATAAGFEARVARLSDRSKVFLDKSFPDDYFLETYDIAVRVGDHWRLYDPASTYVPEGMLRWEEEGEDALLTDPKDPVWIKTPLSPPEKSIEKRVAKLRLADDGTLEGDVRIEYYGHLAADRKNFNEDDSPTRREETLRKSVKARMSTAELSEIKIENVTDPIKPFVYAYHVRVPGYAQRTGKRLFLQPGFFERGVSPLFTASERKNDVYFHYPWSEQDQVAIELPAGYALDNADQPPPITPQMTKNIWGHEIKMGTNGHVLFYDRKFFFGGGGNILFPVASYVSLKQIFDLINKDDNHTISLKQATSN